MGSEPSPDPGRPAERRVGRYVIGPEIASGGMASVHLGRLVGPVGFSRSVAIKRMHPQYAKDPEFVAMFVDEARLAGRIRHPNVAATLDVVAEDDELFLVLELIVGESLSRVIRRVQETGVRIPIPVAVGIATQMLAGLAAAHEAVSEDGKPLGIVHRDVSPQNVLVAANGVSFVIDFGIAKAESQSHQTRDGTIKGKAWYMSPEQMEERPIDHRADVYAASCVLWELFVGRRLVDATTSAGATAQVLRGEFPSPSVVCPGLSPALDGVVMRGLARDPSDRYESARAMAAALERVVTPASSLEIAAWMKGIAGESIDTRTRMVSAFEARRSLGDAAAAPSTIEAPTVVTHETAARASFVPAKHASRAMLVAAVTSGLVIVIGLGALRLLRSDVEVARRASPWITSLARAPRPAPPRKADVAPAASAAPSATPSAAPPVPTAKVPPRRSCDVPYYMENGVKRYREECL